MPVHDWRRPPVGLYHHFHQSWTVVLAERLNDELLPQGYFALIERTVSQTVKQVLAIKNGVSDQMTGATLLSQPPEARFMTQQTDLEVYASRANRVAVRNPLGELAAIIELVSPGNKDSKHAIRSFVNKTVEFLGNGVNLLVIDLFPPTSRDPQGIHKAIWDEFLEEPFEMPADKPLTLAAYQAGAAIAAYVEPVAVGDELVAMPLYLEPGHYVLAPLEETYCRTWEKCPREMRQIVEGASTREND